jgi:hypothetical protein
VPVRYELDELLRCIVVTVEGPFQTDDIFVIMARQRAEHTRTYAMLYDLRVMIGVPTVSELWQLLSQAAGPSQGEGPRGPVALLAADPAHTLGSARTRHSPARRRSRPLCFWTESRPRSG